MQRQEQCSDNTTHPPSTIQTLREFCDPAGKGEAPKLDPANDFQLISQIISMLGEWGGGHPFKIWLQTFQN